MISTCYVLQFEVKQVTSDTQVNGGMLVISTSWTAGRKFLANANTSGRMYRSPTCQIECNNKAVYRLPNDDGHIYSPLVIVIDCVKGIEYASMMRISGDGVVKNNRFIPLRCIRGGRHPLTILQAGDKASMTWICKLKLPYWVPEWGILFLNLPGFRIQMLFAKIYTAISRWRRKELRSYAGVHEQSYWFKGSSK